MEQTAKQQVAEKLRQANNVLVTVSKNPSVDQLASAIGLTLMLNKLGKHTTCVFSGRVPDAMEFLEPQKTIETTVDSLRDFIISLDKEKADKLRYKVDGDVVKIFVTPYRTTITKDDIRFEQGDFNVDVVVALGVTNRDDIDAAIAAHGRILHDAAVVGVNIGETTSSIGAIDWHEPTAGSLSEMLVSISESLEGNIIDAQMATAFLTGIVAATERFSNERTSPKVMTMSAQLMAAGANQQLIAQNLGEDGKPIKPNTELKINEEGAPTEASATVPHDEAKSEEPATAPHDDLELPAPVEEPPQPPESPVEAPSQAPDAPAKPKLEPIEKPIPDKSPYIGEAHGAGPKEQDASNSPTLGGTFNATSAFAEEETAKQKENINNEILAHPVQPTEDFILDPAPAPEPNPAPVSEPAPSPSPPTAATDVASLDEARAAVDSAIQGGEFFPDNNPQIGLGAQPVLDVNPTLAQETPSAPADGMQTFSPDPFAGMPKAAQPAPNPTAPPDMPPPFPPPGLSAMPTPADQPPQPAAPQMPTAPQPPVMDQPAGSDFVIPPLPPVPPQQ